MDELRAEPDPITFHVIYTPGTTAVLLPLAPSLLQAPSARFVLVDNGCGPDESRRLRLVAESERRFEYRRLPFGETVPHGAALDHLLGRCEERTFAILDSDVVASGNFVGDIEPSLAGAAAACTGWPVWLEDAEAACRDAQPFVGGPYRLLPDGTEVGGTACAVYDRAALDAALRRIPHGMRSQTADALDPEMRAAFEARGWSFDRFGTARVAHLQLVLRGEGVTNLDSPHLHHLGGLSHAGDLDRRRVARRLLRGQRSPLGNLVANAARRVSGAGRRQARAYQRKRRVIEYVGSLMRALRRGDDPPPPLETGSAEVDARVCALAETLIECYPGYCEQVHALVRSGAGPAMREPREHERSGWRGDNVAR